MNVYVIAALVIGGVVVTTVITYFGFFKAGKSDGAATATADQAKNDLVKLKKADAIVMTQKPTSEVVKSLNDGTF